PILESWRVSPNTSTETTRVSGIVYYQAETPFSVVGTTTVAVKVNGSGDFSTTTSASDGSYEIDIGQVEEGSTILVYLSESSINIEGFGELPLPSANYVTKSGSSLEIDADLYLGKVLVSNEDSEVPITNADFADFDSTDSQRIAYTLSQTGTADWWNANWGARRKITLNNASSSENL